MVAVQYERYKSDSINRQKESAGILPTFGIFNLSCHLKGADAGTAANYGKFWIAPYKCKVLGVTEIHGHVGGTSAAVTLERLQGTEALNSGDDLLTSVFDLTATADTLQEGTLTATTANLTLEAGDRLALKDSGTMTAATDVDVTVQLQWVRQ